MNVFDEVKQLMMSQTMQRLAQLAQTLPTDTSDPDELKAAFSTCGIDLINALDNDRIHFDDDRDKAMFYGLLTVTVNYVLDGNLGRTEQARIN